jgi:hypothetical protein
VVQELTGFGSRATEDIILPQKAELNRLAGENFSRRCERELDRIQKIHPKSLLFVPNSRTVGIIYTYKAYYES